MTILPIAVRARLPLVIFGGEAPLHKPWYNQGIDQAPFVNACGAQYRALHDPATMLDDIRDAFATARRDRVPVVLGVPFDVQKQEWTSDASYQNLDASLQVDRPLLPNVDEVATAADWIAKAKRPILLAGLGAVSSGSHAACVALAETAGALLATTLPAKGFFHDQPYCLGVAGGYASDRAKAIFADADLVISFGARLASHTFDGGKLTPDARVIHVDVEPQAEVQGRRASDLSVRADARLGAEALLKQVTAREGWRTDEMRAKSAAALDLSEEAETPDGALHPLAVIRKLSEVIPPACHIVNTSGHCAYYSAQMNFHPQSHFTVIRDFGAIGNGTSFAIGVAAAYPDRPVVLIDGDGSALMHIQELETIARHDMKVLIIVLNDGAYGSEVHKLRADGVTLAGSVFGRPDFAAIGRGFGFDGRTVTDLDGLADAMDGFLSSSAPAIWDIHISDQIASPQILKLHRSH
jgi:thiamine pyrophosphate-dependent acetolactate synthase large subunit-like protein